MRASPGLSDTILQDTAQDAASADVDAFIALVGARTRRARALRAMSRRVLSERSGVSQRYLAQLESGQGNISIGLLMRVAQALKMRIEFLVGEDDPWESETVQMAQHFRDASPEQRQRVRQILNVGPDHETRRQRICLIGLRGAGKSTLGRLLGAELGLPFTELNQHIEEQSGMPVAEVMALYGQEGYRRLEHEALERIVTERDAVVLAVAGGIVSESETFTLLLRNFHTIWLRASPGEHMERVRAQGDRRPMAGNPKAMEELTSILTSREALYARAQATVNTSGESVEDSLARLRHVVEELGIAADED
ncbi:transcriptional regulator [Maritimibacter sp. 55A14]|uniref:helix-turn-helix transcriptional regulator n=1 Tax=Maritimibacter sp. 55A14 TaxID=2174844 RepID=UPI000D60646D|nr:helix-turn-helix transcriptional regulator [Maritimibacter sp. 55A14]PWE34446.1 transcriptional regulator [Maritimibacter sp. 55A14]